METNNSARLDALYRAHGRDVYSYCVRRTSIEDAKDATADVFVVAWRRIEEVPAGEEGLPWLFGVARNVLSNRQRARRRRGRLAAKLSGRTLGTEPGPEPQIVRRAEYQELHEALAKLSPKDQEILRLVEWEGFTREQVAAMFYVGRAAIDKRISRAYRRMARTLGGSTTGPLTTPVTVEEGGEA